MSIGFIFFIAIIGVIEQRVIIENNSNKSNNNIIGLKEMSFIDSSAGRLKLVANPFVIRVFVN